MSVSRDSEVVTTTPAGSDTRTALYRFFDADGRLLYVGMTHRLAARTSEHSRSAATTWWPKVASRTIEWFDSRSEAKTAESSAIRSENPAFNVMHTRRNRAPLGTHKGGPVRKPSLQRGQGLLRKAAEKFGADPFTRIELLAVSGLRQSAVDKNVQALVNRGCLVVVGTKRFTGALAGRPHLLYIVAGTQAARTLREVHQVVQGDPDGRAPRRIWPPAQRKIDPQRMSERTMALLRQAEENFGDSPFTRKELSAASGMDPANISKHIRRLLHHGFIESAGNRHTSGIRGHSPMQYAISRTAVSR